MHKGGVAFPSPFDTNKKGLFTRDYFAVEAMKVIYPTIKGRTVLSYRKISVEAYRLADAMIQERDRRNK